MKSIDVKKIGTIVAGTAMLGAALAAPVSAAADFTGVDKGFFYDANMNPIVQIVVGEKGMATDAVAAGNIAATVGNLAYMTKTETFSPEYEPAGQVVIETAAIGATGDYVQDTLPDEATADFYDDDDDAGFVFTGTNWKVYERGDFTQYALACEQQERSDAGILLEGTYNNIHCLFCKTLCVEGLKNPSHEMAEKIYVNQSKIRYYEEGLGDDDTEAFKMAIQKDALMYVVETGFIPTEDMDVTTGTTEKFADFEYRGKIIFMGKEYYVKDIESDKIYLAEGKVLDDITSEGYTSEFHGYKFKIDHLIYSGEYEVAGILLDVEKPDGTIVQTQISKMANGVVDDLEVSGVYAEAAGAVETASIIVYDTATEVVLEDGEDLELGGVTYDGWKVEWSDFAMPCNSTTWGTEGDLGLDDCEIDEYDTDEANAYDVLGAIKVTLKDKVEGADALEVDESLNFPSQFMLTFKGFMTSSYKEVACSGADEGNILLERGDEAYQLLLSFTGDDGNRYDEVRLDEGPFTRGDQFAMDGGVWEFEKYESSGSGVDETIDVTRKPLLSGSKVKSTLVKYCDSDDEWAGAETNTPGVTRDNCSDLDDVTLRKIALIDAMDDDDASDFENDENVTLSPEDLFWGTDDDNGLVIWFDESSNAIVYTDDTNLTVNPTMVGTITEFDTELDVSLRFVREAGFNAADVDGNVAYNETNDLNQDSAGEIATNGNDDDLLAYFTTADDTNTEIVVVDFSDRGYDETQGGNSYLYKNSVGYYATFSTTNGSLNTPIIDLTEDTDTDLILPFSGEAYTLDWGIDNRLDAIELCHPEKAVDATYFLGIGEEATYVEDTVTKDDEGTEVTAGCCTFKVKEFSVDVGDDTEQSYTTATVNKIVGALVVPEVGADTTKNLVIVGGPSVNGMCTVTVDEIEAEADKYVVKKDGNLLIVAGYEYEETLAAGDEVIDWLYANVQ